MNAIQNIAKNVGVLFTSQIVNYIFTFFIVIYTARYLGTEGFGILSLALSISAIVGIFSEFGFNSLMIREVARNKNITSKFVSNVTLIKLVLSLCTFGITSLIVTLLDYSELVKFVIYIITISVIINSFAGIFSSIFQANEKMEYLSVSTILNSAILLIGTLIGIYYNFDILFFASIYVISSSFVFIYIFLAYLMNYSLPKLDDFDLSFCSVNFKEAFFFGISAILVSVYFYIASIILSVVDGNYAVGVFNAAWRLITVFLFIPNVITIALFPVMSRHFTSSKDFLELEYNKTFKYLFVISILILVYGFMFADEIILLAYGPNYLDSVIILKVLVFVVPVIFLTSLLGNLLGTVNRQRFVTIVAAVNAILNVSLNLILIPEFSYIGASVVTFVTESFGFLIMFSYISKYMFKISITNSLARILLIGVIVAIVIYYLEFEINWILTGVFGLILYILLLILLKVISKDDVHLFKNIFVRKDD